MNVRFTQFDWDADTLIAALRTSLANSRPRVWARKHAPRLSYGRHAGPPRVDARQAAVLLLLYPHDGQWQLVLTERQPHLSSHAGQVSLPGGALELGESSCQAALRETEEELGVCRSAWQVVGELSPIYIFNSNYAVTPYVAVAPDAPVFAPCADEVASLVALPLDELLAAPDRPGTYLIQRGQLTFSAPCLHWQSRSVWGATWVILGEFLDVLMQLKGP